MLSVIKRSRFNFGSLISTMLFLKIYYHYCSSYCDKVKINVCASLKLEYSWMCTATIPVAIERTVLKFYVDIGWSRLTIPWCQLELEGVMHTSRIHKPTHLPGHKIVLLESGKSNINELDRYQLKVWNKKAYRNSCPWYMHPRCHHIWVLLVLPRQCQ